MTLINNLKQFVRVYPKTVLCSFSFVIGIGIELTMNFLRVNGENFYDIARRKQAERLIEQEKAKLKNE